jgi:adenosylhomocysteine nucleosidase
MPEEARPVARALRGDRARNSPQVLCHPFFFALSLFRAFATKIRPSDRSGGQRSLVELIRGDLGGQPVLLAWSGAGASGAARTARKLLSEGVGAVLAVGFAGALSPALRPGDLIAAREVMRPGGKCWPADLELLSLAEGFSKELQAPAEPGVPASTRPSSGPKTQFCVGTLVSTARVVTTAAEKRRLREETEALAVDMESAVVAEEAARAGVPMLALRVITDGADESLPLDFDLCFDSDGKFHRTRLIWLLARRPTALGGLLRLGRNSARAGQTLVDLLGWYVPRLEARGEPRRG